MNGIETYRPHRAAKSSRMASTPATVAADRNAHPEPGRCCTRREHIRENMNVVTRRAMAIGLGRCEGQQDLEKAPGLAKQIGSVLADLGYGVQEVDREPSSAQLGSGVSGFLESGGVEDLAIVHLCAHGTANAG